MFELFTTGQSAWVNNNIFYNGPATAGNAPTIFEFATNQGNITFGQNWVSPGWLASESAELGRSFSGTITGTSNFFTDPNNNSRICQPERRQLSTLEYLECDRDRRALSTRAGPR